MFVTVRTETDFIILIGDGTAIKTDILILPFSIRKREAPVQVRLLMAITVTVR